MSERERTVDAAQADRSLLRSAAPGILARAVIPVATLRGDLLICGECDLLHVKPQVPDQSAKGDVKLDRHLLCQRCGASLGLIRPHSLRVPLALALTALVMLLIAHLNTVLSINVQSQVRSTTLMGAVVTLYQEGDGILSVLVVATTLRAPLMYLGAIAFVLLPLRSRQRAVGFRLVMRCIERIRPWVMIEVFLLGVLVALVKLSGLASVVPGAGLWAFASVMVLSAATTSTFDPEHVWDELRRHGPDFKDEAEAARTATPGAQGPEINNRSPS